MISKTAKENWIKAILKVADKMERVDSDLASFGFITSNTIDILIEEARSWLNHFTPKHTPNKIRMANKLESIATYHIERGLAASFSIKVLELMGCKVPASVISTEEPPMYNFNEKRNPIMYRNDTSE